MTKQITVIGSGLGGLLTAFLLSKEGLEVTLLEKHRKFGGCLQSFRRDRYTFDTGMHYIGSMAPGQPLHRFWSYFGLTGKLPLRNMDPDGFDRISFGSDEHPGTLTAFPLAQGFDNFREQLLPLFPEAGPILTSYIHTLDEITQSHPLYNLDLPAGNTGESFSHVCAFNHLRELTSGIRNPASGIPLADVLSGNHFLYAGTPATPLSQFGLISHSFISSAWRIEGGSQQLADLLVEGIRANGGNLLANKNVRSIRKEGDRFTVVTADGERFDAGVVVSDIHPAATLKLVDDIPMQRAYATRILSLRNTPSSFAIYLGLKPDTFPYLNHNVYHHQASNARASQFLFMTPPEKDQGPFASTAVVMTPMLFDEVREWEQSLPGARDKSYAEFKENRAMLLLDRVCSRFPELKEAVGTIETSTPLTWRDYTGTPEGSMYGIAKDAGQPEKTTVFPRTKIPGLYFTGQNINLHGALGVTIGAVLTCGEILGLPYVMGRIKGVFL